jgi:signal transduction histidine kinase/ligand-binding sensor domain-containing protein
MMLLLFGGVATFGERLPVKIYTSADGLASTFVNSVMRDSRGFLWFATRDGISRFDGREFKNYQVAEKNAPPGIEQIYETRTGMYWIVTTGGLYRFDPQTANQNPAPNDPRRAALDTEFVSPARGRLYEDSRGRLWLGGDALYLIERQTGDFIVRKVETGYAEENWRGYFINGFSETSDGSLWLTTTRGLMRRLPDERTVYYTLVEWSGAALNSSLADEAGRKWIATENAVYIFRPEPVAEFVGNESIITRRLTLAPRGDAPTGNDLMFPEKPGEIVRAVESRGGARFRRLFRSSDNRIWIAAIDSLLEFDGRKLRTYDAAYGLSAQVVDIAEDSNENLWFGGQQGATRFNRRGISSFAPSDGLASPLIHSVYSRNDELYAVNGNGFVSRFNGRGFDTVRLQIEPNAVFSWTTSAGFLDNAGHWWVLTGDRLYRFAAPENFSDLARQKPLAVYTSGADGNDSYYRMFEDRRGDLWISTRDRDLTGANLTLWTRADEKFHVFSGKEGFPGGKLAASFAEAADGAVWLGFYDGGLVRFRNGHFTEIKENLPAGAILDLQFDKSGRLWLTSTENGLSRIDDPAAANPDFVRLTTENGLSSNNVRSITEAADGDLYVGTARGVDRISIETGKIRHFSPADGLAGEFVVAGVLDSGGASWFGTPNGLSRFDSRTEPPEAVSPVWIGGLRVAGENRSVPLLGAREIDKLELAPNQNNLQIDFFSFDFSPAGAIRYQYKLEGADAEWSAPSAQRSVNYANLAAGSYRFLVRAVGSDDTAGHEPARVEFVVLAPVWRRWWFIGAAIFLIAAGVLALDRYRIRKTREVESALAALRKSKEERLAELERVRSRIARDLHDDVGSSLTQIALVSEVARQTRDGADASEEPLEFLVQTSNELVEAMSDIVWAINPGKDRFIDLTQRMRRFASETLTAAGIDLEFAAPESGTDAPLGANLRREIFLIFKEAINNIVKHAEAKRVEVEFSAGEGFLTLGLKDDGRGFEAARDRADFDWRARTGNGLASMRRRAAELGGAFEIESAIGAGTRIRLRIPLDINLEKTFSPD